MSSISLASACALRSMPAAARAGPVGSPPTELSAWAPGHGRGDRIFQLVRHHGEKLVLRAVGHQGGAARLVELPGAPLELEVGAQHR
jgi:hypothetical protein